MTNQERGRRERGVDEDRDAKKRPVGFGSTPAHAHVETQGVVSHMPWHVRRKDCRDTSACETRVGLRRVSASETGRPRASDRGLTCAGEKHGSIPKGSEAVQPVVSCALACAVHDPGFPVRSHAHPPLRFSRVSEDVADEAARRARSNKNPGHTRKARQNTDAHSRGQTQPVPLSSRVRHGACRAHRVLKD